MKNRFYSNSFALALISALTLSGCAGKKTTTDLSLVRPAFEAQQAQVKTFKGRAWVTVKSQRGDGASFPVVVAIDRTSPEGFSKLYLEITDLVGETRSRITIPSKGLLIWQDMDAPVELQTKKFRNAWRGIPIEILPDVLLGLFASSAVKSVPGIVPEAQWIEPGPRPVLSRLTGKVAEKNFEVSYKAFGDHQNFYLPTELELNSAEISMHLSWRERYWNVPVAATVFDRK